MGELADILATESGRNEIRQHGANIRTTDPVELVRDLVALRRAIPESTLLACDSPAEQEYGYLGYWYWDPTTNMVAPPRSSGHALQGHYLEVSATLRMPVMRLASWDGRGPQADYVRQVFRTAQGRQDLVRALQEGTVMPAFDLPEPPPEPQPEPEVYCPTRWERLLDDEPL